MAGGGISNSFLSPSRTGLGVSIYISKAQPVLAVVFDFGFKNSLSRWERVRMRNLA
jgi:hypothetical protein